MGILNVLKLVVKGNFKNYLRRSLSNSERFILTTMGKCTDRVSTILVPMNIDPKFVNPKYHWKLFLKDPKFNIEVARKLIYLYNPDMIANVYWGGPLLGSGLPEMGVPMQIVNWNYPTNVDTIVKDAEDLAGIDIPDSSEYFHYSVETYALAQEEFPESIQSPLITGPFTLGCFVRGQIQLMEDFVSYLSYINAESEKEKKLIEKYCEEELEIYPTFFLDEIEVYKEIVKKIIREYRRNDVDPLGTIIWELYASPPIVEVKDFLEHVYPYVLDTLKLLKRQNPAVTYYPNTEGSYEKLLRLSVKEKKYSPLTTLVAPICFDVNRMGILDVDDAQMIKLCGEISRCYTYTVMPYFLRDALATEVYNHVANLCKLAVQNETPLIITPVAITSDTPKQNIDAVFKAVEDHGYYR